MTADQVNLQLNRNQEDLARTLQKASACIQALEDINRDTTQTPNSQLYSLEQKLKELQTLTNEFWANMGQRRGILPHLPMKVAPEGGRTAWVGML